MSKCVIYVVIKAFLFYENPGKISMSYLSS